MISKSYAYIIFNIFCILIFSVIYDILSSDHFILTRDKKKPTYIDFISLSITIQSTVGLTDIVPKTTLAKSIVLLQQLISMSALGILLFSFKEYINF